MFWIAKTIANLFGLDVSIVQRVVMITAIALIGIGMLAFGLCMKSCFTKTPKLNEKEIQQVNEAIETKERQKMEEAFVVVEQKRSEIDANTATGRNVLVNTQVDAKNRVKAMTDEELAAFLESQVNQ